MERVEPRRSIREEEKSIGGRAGQYATGWSHIAHLFCVMEEKRRQTGTKERSSELVMGKTKPAVVRRVPRDNSVPSDPHLHQHRRHQNRRRHIVTAHNDGRRAKATHSKRRLTWRQATTLGDIYKRCCHVGPSHFGQTP